MHIRFRYGLIRLKKNGTVKQLLLKAYNVKFKIEALGIFMEYFERSI
jgi:hypothetical protein